MFLPKHSHKKIKTRFIFNLSSFYLKNVNNKNTLVNSTRKTVSNTFKTNASNIVSTWSYTLSYGNKENVVSGMCQVTSGSYRTRKALLDIIPVIIYGLHKNDRKGTSKMHGSVCFPIVCKQTLALHWKEYGNIFAQSKVICNTFSETLRPFRSLAWPLFKPDEGFSTNTKMEGPCCTTPKGQTSRTFLCNSPRIH